MDAEYAARVRSVAALRVDPESEYLASLRITQETIDYYASYLRTHPKVRTVHFEDLVKYADADKGVYINGLLHHYLEVKTRRNKFGEYKHTKVPLRKHTFAEHSLKSENLTSYFLVRFSDGVIGFLNLADEPDMVTQQVARYDRGTDQDIYAMYAVSRLKIIKEP